MVRSGEPEEIAGVVRQTTLGGGASSVVFLFVVAAAAFNGALN
jgi:hypothetical protein